MSTTQSGGFEIKKAKLIQKGFAYETFKVVGYLNGQRIRRQFKSRDEAVGEVNRLEVQALNSNGQIRAVITRLSDGQIRDAEAAFASLGATSLQAAVQWYLNNYRPPVTETLLDTARDAFIADRTPHISKVALRDYKRTLRDFIAIYPQRSAHTVKTEDVQAFLTARKVGPKRFNNMRGDLNAFFVFCCSPARKWATENPVAAIAKFKIDRGIPEIITTKKAAELMAFVETYTGGSRSNLPPGCLVPYFALALFAGLRPSVKDGEIRKLGESPDVAKLVDVGLGVIRITPEISKTGSVRQVKIRPNLAAWLKRYPLEKFPIVVPNLQDMVTQVRRQFELGDDVLRHTMISSHVSAFKSLGEAALEAGNSEAMIRKHYLNLVAEQDAKRFWKIGPKS